MPLSGANTVQVPLFSGEPGRETTHWDHVLAIAKAAVAAVTLKEFAYRVDAQPSGVADALAERDRKRLAAEHLLALLTMAPEDHRRALLDAIARPLGYRVERVVPLTPSEEVAATRAYLAKMAPGLLAGLDKEIGR